MRKRKLSRRQEPDVGIENREYYQRDEAMRYGEFGGPWSWTGKLIVVLVAVWIVDSLFVVTEPVRYHPITRLGAATADWMTRPWEIYRLFTSVFLHATMDERNGITHILFNGIGLWVFGRRMEHYFGKVGFLAFFIVSGFFAGLFSTSINTLALGHSISSVGASGAVVALVVIFACIYPTLRLNIMGVFELPAWGLAAIYVGLDILGAGMNSGDRVDHYAHLGGALFAGITFGLGIPFERLSGLENGRFSLKSLMWWRRPKLKVYREESSEDKIVAEGERLLEKISNQGKQSLTKKELKQLEKYSELTRSRQQKTKVHSNDE